MVKMLNRDISARLRTLLSSSAQIFYWQFHFFFLIYRSIVRFDQQNLRILETCTNFQKNCALHSGGNHTALAQSTRLARKPAYKKHVSPRGLRLVPRISQRSAGVGRSPADRSRWGASQPGKAGK